MVSESFETPGAGFPGSPSHVVARELLSTSAIVCWTESNIGQPFTYHVDITEVNSNTEVKTRQFNSSSIGAFPNIDCGTGVKVLLKPVKCDCDDPLPYYFSRFPDSILTHATGSECTIPTTLVLVVIVISQRSTALPPVTMAETLVISWPWQVNVSLVKFDWAIIGVCIH